jgi:hypothetical protein
MPPENWNIDLDTLARRVVQGLDRRSAHSPRQPNTRLAAQSNSTVISNSHRILNLVSAGAGVIADGTNHRTNLAIPCGYLYAVADGGGLPLSVGAIPTASVHVHDNLQVVQWSVITDQPGSVTLDVRSSTWAAYPSTSSIVTGTAPSTSGTQNSASPDYMDPTTGQVSATWTPLLWANLSIGDVVDIIVTATDGIVTHVTLTLQCQGIYVPPAPPPGP